MLIYYEKESEQRFLLHIGIQLNSTMEKYFSKKIKKVRLKLGYSQFDFAKLLQMSQIELHQIESGQINARIEILSKFAEVAFYEIISPFKKKDKSKEQDDDEPKSLLSIIPQDDE